MLSTIAFYLPVMKVADLESEELGDVILAETGGTNTVVFCPAGWRQIKKGWRVLLDLVIHAIDNVWFMMDCPSYEVMAGLTARCHLAPPEQPTPR